jgi:predicted subunit of tRNA(5-methylaminomethyl-2-thiouridylate) methyltransferase
MLSNHEGMISDSCENKIEQNPADVLIYESIAQTCIEKGFAQQAVKCLHQAALLCLKTKQFEKMEQLLRQMYAVEGGSSLARQLEVEIEASEKNK